MKRYAWLATVLVFCSVSIAIYSAPVKSSDGENITGPIAAQDADVREKINALNSSNPVQRASAACCLGEMRERAIAAIPYLIQMLADDTVINAVIDCGEKNSWRSRNNFVEDTSPGRIAAEAARS